jgi:midasin
VEPSRQVQQLAAQLTAAAQGACQALLCAPEHHSTSHAHAPAPAAAVGLPPGAAERAAALQSSLAAYAALAEGGGGRQQQHEGGGGPAAALLRRLDLLGAIVAQLLALPGAAADAGRLPALASELAALRGRLASEGAAGGAGRFEWVDGALTRAVECGGWVLLDNANLCNPTVLDRLNPLLEPGGCLYINECGQVGGPGRAGGRVRLRSGPACFLLRRAGRGWERGVVGAGARALLAPDQPAPAPAAAQRPPPP